MDDDIPVHGDVDPTFAPLLDMARQSIESGDDLGLGLSIIIDGVPTVNITAGWQDRKKSTSFGDTLVCVYSCGKAILSAFIMAAVERGDLDYERAVADYWPAFATHGKEKITIAQALSHQGGLAAFTDEIDPALWLDWDGLCAALAAMPPLWPPGMNQGYHPQTVGYIGGELLRRTTGKTVGEHLRALDVDVICGIDDTLRSRTGPMVKPKSPPDLGDITPLKQAAFMAKWSSAAGVSREAWAAAEIPASNMHATAHGLANVMQAYATGKINGKHVASEAVRDAAIAERTCRDDLVLPFRLSWGAGVMRNRDGQLGPSDTAVGHYGFGGACVLADPTHSLSFAFVPNKMSPALVADDRVIRLLNKLYALL
ncbi:MAG: serine hydrolase domain-containing protein [Pseudomonadota bacterium]